MPKIKLIELADEYALSFEEAQDFVANNLEEDMVTGKGKNTWINDDGQVLFDEMIPMNVIYRGKVMHYAPNKNFVYAHIRELGKKVAVKIPLRRISNLEGKMIHIEADNKSDPPKYFYRKN